MARLEIITLPGLGIDSHEIEIHGQIVGDDGVVNVYGDCGDGTIHPLRYTVRGSPGAVWYVRIRCGSDLIHVDDVTIGSAGIFKSGPRELKLSPIAFKMRRLEANYGSANTAASAAAAISTVAATIHSYTLKVEAENFRTWALFLDEEPVDDFNKDGEAPLQLTPGEHYFFYDLRGAGAKLSIDLVGEPDVRIIEPEDEWPFEVKVPVDRTGRADRFYILVGA